MEETKGFAFETVSKTLDLIVKEADILTKVARQYGFMEKQAFINLYEKRDGCFGITWQ